MKQMFSSKNRMLAVMVTLILGLFVANLAYTTDVEAQLGKIHSVLALRAAFDDSLTLNGRFKVTGSNFVTIDSFTTTALLDTIVMTGAVAGDVILAFPYTPLWSATPDTGYFYHGYVLNTDSVVIGRTADDATGLDPKSGGQYAAARFEK